MGFFDDLGKKVTDAGQKTVQKTKEMSEVARVNSLISQNENRINNIYYQIGKLYVNIHEFDYEEEFGGMISQVIELEQQISEFRKQIQEIKGIQFCEKCGAEVARGVAYCSSCGAVMPRPEKQEYYEDCVKCARCGSWVKKGMRFCTSCGQSMMKLNVAEINNDMEESASYNEEFVERVCPRCGTKQTDDSAFCTECGARL
ncbi:MAG: zinc-ribbon domain-containing protein [Frisingicoccus sp.]|uniref:zinc-ribbon domain-containing protein n=1 Tax=Frisingicoccus sp. TaxID=1918627 RepID=UPI0026223077|nr:zinc-ribbon domain-containing protein [Frisingicoccus sp.]MDD6233376.1 zinc-ribbon domain-containing protein [Frisingicoccus sp.]